MVVEHDHDIGWHARPHLAFLLRAQLHTFWVDQPGIGGAQSFLTYGTYQLATQYWLGSRWFAGGGLLLAVVNDIWNNFAANIPAARGIGLSLRGGRQLGSSAFALVAELSPSFYRYDGILATAALFLECRY